MATETEEAEQPECRYCGDPVDHLEPGHYKSPGDKFAHAECVADHCYEDREKVATDEGVFRIKSVTIMKTVGTKEELLDSYWQAECPVCYRTHETDDHSEDVRTDLIDQVCECCGAEWLPPSDWIEDCEICGTSHRESRDCKPLSMREPFPDPDEHRYECAKCEWSGEGDEFGNPDGYCPECDSAAVRALKVATDGGKTLRDDVEHAPDRPLGTAQARKVNRNALRASLHERGFIGVDLTMHNRDYALVDLSGVPEPRQEVAEVYFESWGAAFREHDVQGFDWGVRI